MGRLFAWVGLTVCLTACGGADNGNVTPRPDAQPPANEQPATKHDPAQAARLKEQAAEKYVDGDASGALELLQRAEPLDPQNSELLAFLARTYEKLRRFEEAREVYLRAAKLVDGKELYNMETGAAHCSELLAHQQYSAGSYDAAAGHIADATALRPDSRESQMLRGYIQMQRGQYDDAAEGFQAALGLSVGAQQYEALSWLGQAQYAARDFAAAADSFTQLIDQGVSGYEAYGWRAYCNLGLQDKEATERDLRQALQRTDNDVKKQEYRDALQALEDAK